MGSSCELGLVALELIYGMVSWWLWLSQVDSELLGSPFPKRMADTNDGGISLAELVLVAGVVIRAARLCGVGLMRMAEFFVQLLGSSFPKRMANTKDDCMIMAELVAAAGVVMSSCAWPSMRCRCGQVGCRPYIDHFASALWLQGFCPSWEPYFDRGGAHSEHFSLGVGLQQCGL